MALRNSIYILTALWLCACASKQPVEAPRPDAALQAAVDAQDCTGVYNAMSYDVKLQFPTEEAFCGYYQAHRDQFEAWAAQLEGRMISGDYRHYAYLADDPEGPLRLEFQNGVWAFEQSPYTASLVDPETLQESFTSYIWSRTFLRQLETFADENQPAHSGVIMNRAAKALREGTENSSISFYGPFAHVKLGEGLQVIFYYEKQNASEGNWVLYQCHLNP